MKDLNKTHPNINVGSRELYLRDVQKIFVTQLDEI